MSLLNDASLILVPSSIKTGEVLVQKPLPNKFADETGNYDGNDPQTNANLTFTRASNASRVNSDGLVEKVRTNLLFQSNTFSTSWSAILGASITGGQTGYDGSSDAWRFTKDAAQASRIYQDITISPTLHTTSIYAKANTLQYLAVLEFSGPVAYFDLQGGSIGTLSASAIEAKIEAVGATGWYRCSVTSNSAITQLRIYATDTDGTINGSGSIFIQDAQVNYGLVATDYIPTTTASVSVGPVANLPRLDYSGGATCPSLLLEPQRTNIAANSEYMLGFTKGSASSLEANAAISPEGRNNATYFYCNTTTTNAYLLPSFSGTSGVQYAVSFYAKAKELSLVYIKNVNDSGSQCYFDLSNGTFTLLSGIDSMSIEDAGNGWYRCTAVSTSTTTGIKWIPILKGDANEGVYVYGLQIEQASYATSYIPTYGTSVTRLADACSKTGISSLIGQTEGTLFAEVEITNFKEGVTQDIVLSAYTNVSNRIMLSFDGTGTKTIYVFIRSLSTSYDFAQAQNFELGVNKLAFSYGSNYRAIYLNGSKISESTATFPVPPISNIAVGSRDDLTGQFGDGIKQVLVFPNKLTDAQAIELTTL